MSQQELERGDQEVMGVVNSHSHPEAAAAAEKIEKRLDPALCGETEQGCECGAGCDGMTQEEFDREYAQFKKAQRKKDRTQVAACVMMCAIVAALLLVAFYVPDLLIWVVNLGVLSCGMVAAVQLDRFVKHRWG